MAIRPLPYFQVRGTIYEKQLATELRKDFIPVVKRRLPYHHLSGFDNTTVTGFVKRYKEEYPYFFRADIACFYPTLPHREAMVELQMAYKGLLGLPYVPKRFKQKYLKPLSDWFASLPCVRGIPIGSSLSAIVSALVLMPLWLELKKMPGVKFIVYMDDILVLGKSEGEIAECYQVINHHLDTQLQLHLNERKTHSGRLSLEEVHYCGWSFKGGYARISMEKIAAFKTRFLDAVKQSRRKPIRSFIKRVNRKIDGFGNYYKHGSVGKQFEELDGFIRKELRGYLKRYYHGAVGGTLTNQRFVELGFHSLLNSYRRAKGNAAVKQPRPPRSITLPAPARNDTGFGEQTLVEIRNLLEKVVAQQKLMLSMQRRGLAQLGVNLHKL